MSIDSDSDNMQGILKGENMCKKIEVEEWSHHSFSFTVLMKKDLCAHGCFCKSFGKCDSSTNKVGSIDRQNSRTLEWSMVMLDKKHLCLAVVQN